MASIDRMMEWARQHPTATQVGVGALLTLLLKQLVLDKLYGGINEWLGNQAKAFLGEAYEPLMGTLLEYVLPAAVAFTLVFAAYALGRMGLSKNTSGVSSEPDIMAQNPMRWTFLQKRHGFLMGRTTDYGAEILGFQTTGVNKTGKFIKDLGGFVRSERNGKTYGLLIQDGNSRVSVEKLGIPGEHQFHIQVPFFDGGGMPVVRFISEYGQLTFEFQYDGITDQHIFTPEEVEAEALRIEEDLKPKPSRSSAGPVRIDGTEEIKPRTAAEKKVAERARFLQMRQELEEPLEKVGGALVRYEFPENGIGKIEIQDGGTAYAVNMSKGGGTQVWIYDKDDSIKSLYKIGEASRGEQIDLQSFRKSQGSESLQIGETAILEASDGKIIQVLVVGVLYYGAGDPRDEVSIRYKTHPASELILKAL